MNKRLILVFLLFYAFNVTAHHEPATNKDGSIVTGVLTAAFDPFGNSYPEAVLPFPSSLAFFTSTDATLDIPVDDPSNTGDPLVALSAMDGYSTTEKWVTGFFDTVAGGSRYTNPVPGVINPATVVPGQSVRVFEVGTYQYLAVTNIVKELTPWVDYIALAVTDSQIAIIPMKPLKESTSYMAVLTNDIQDSAGNDATPDRAYNFGKTSVPWVDASGNSTNALFDNASAALLEQIRQVVQSMELNAASVGINPADIVLAWTVQTQNITRTLKTLRAYAQPAPTSIVQTPMNTGMVLPGSPGVADIYIGTITVPYYSDVPSEVNPTAHLTSFWQAAPGAYAPPFDTIPLDPTSTHVTVANPIPVKNNDQTIPMMITVPNIMAKPEGGWPVVIYGHGVTRNRTDVLSVADTLASIGYAAVAIDFPIHGVSPHAEPQLAPFWVENTPFAAVANERTFDSDLLNNTTLSFGGDELIDPSGVIVIPGSLGSMLTARDTIRQGIADLSVLAVSIASMDIDNDGQPDLDASNMAYVGISWGAMHGTAFTAIEPLITRSFLSVPGGGIARFMDASPTFGPVVRGTLAGSGIDSNSALYQQVMTLWQTMLDSADPINWAAEAAEKTPIMLHEVIGDDVIPNGVATAPLSGTEPMIAVMGLDSYSTSQQDPNGLRSAARFVPPATHSSMGSPASSPAAFMEMQSQMASFIASHGGQILVTDENTMVPDITVEIQSTPDLTEKGGSKSSAGRKGVGKGDIYIPPQRLETLNRADRLNRFE